MVLDPAADHSTAAMAARAAVSERHLARIGPELLPANLEYLAAAKKAHATSGKAEEFVAAVSASQPERTTDMWLNWSSQMLYGHVAP